AAAVTDFSWRGVQRCPDNRIMSTVRSVANIAVVVSIAVFIAAWLAVESGAQAPDKASLAGAWTRNNEASDAPPGGGERDGDSRGGMRGGGRRGGYGRGGGMGRGGFGGGGRAAAANPDEMKRMRDALRDLTTLPDHMTIVQTDSLVVITAADGQTT